MSLLHKIGKGSIDLAISAGGEKFDLASDRRSSFLHVFGLDYSICIVWVDQYTEASGLWQQFTQSIQAIRETLIRAGITLLPDDGKGVGVRGKARKGRRQ